MLRTFVVVLILTILLGCAQTPIANSSLEPADPPIVWVMSSAAAGSDVEGELLFSVMVGEMAVQYGELGLASDYFVHAANLSSDPRIAERATRVALAAERPRQALQGVQRWLALAPGELEATQLAVVLEIEAGRWSNAVPHLQRIVQVLGPETGGRVIVALLSRSEDAPATLQTLQRLVDSAPEERIFWQIHAEVALRLREFAAAERIARAGLERMPDVLPLQMALARALTEQEAFAAALDAYRMAVDAHPERREVRLAYARALVNDGNFARIRPEFDRLLAWAPDDVDLLLTTALLSLEAGEYVLAQGYLERLLADGQRAHDAQYYLGRLSEQNGDLSTARAYYLLVGEGEHQEDARLREALLTWELEGREAAQARLQSLQNDASPELAMNAFLAEISALREHGWLDLALERSARGLVQFPAATPILYLRGLVYENMGDIAAAEADFRAILVQEPENASALNALGYTLADRTDRYDEAFTLIRQALDLRPEDAVIIDSYGWVLYRLGRTEAALEHLQQAYALMEDGEIASNLAVVLWALGRVEESRQLLEQALEREPDHTRLLRVRQELFP